MRQRRYLMCRPTHFAVEYSINPWMDPTAPVDTKLALAQWESLRSAYLGLGHLVDEIEPILGLPDMVFAANGGLVIDGIAYGAMFRFPERAPEGPAYLDWFGRAGYRVHEAKQVNEGEGDLLLTDHCLLAGTGFRTEPAAHLEAEKLYGRQVVTLELVNPCFYHLDTALCVLRGDHIAYLPEAFSPDSQQKLAAMFPDALIARVEDASVLGLNAVSDGHNVVLAAQATGFADQLEAAGYQPVPVDVSELRKAGGGPKCCTLELR